MTDPTPVDTAALRRLLADERLPAGPWQPYLSGGGWVVLDADNNDILHTHRDDPDCLHGLVIDAVNALPSLLDEVERLRALAKLAGEHEHEWQPNESGACELCGNEETHPLHPALVSALWRDTDPGDGTLYMESRVPALAEGEYLTIFRTAHPPTDDTPERVADHGIPREVKP